jgi:ABC-type nickel/cobalt efflux system permease component RcnA
MSIKRKTINYDVGALVVLAISIGLAVIVYSVNILSFDVFNIPAWILGPLGVYTIVFSFKARGESTYYLVWGVIMFAIATASAFYNTQNVLAVLGILLIVIAVIAIVAYLRGK